MKLSDLRIGAKLGGAFGLLVFMTLALGLTALLALGRINDDTTDFATNWLPSVQLLGDMRTMANRMRRAESEAAISPDPAAREKYGTQLVQLRKEYDALEARYASTVTAGEEQAAFDNYKGKRDAYFAEQAKLVDASRNASADAAQLQAVSQLYSTTGEAAFGALAEAIGALSAMHTADSGQSYKMAQADYGKAVATTIAIAVAAIVLGALLAWRITRSITGKVQHAVDVARAVAAGDLSVHVQAEGKDELGLLLHALHDMRENLARVVAGVRTAAEGVATASVEISQGNNDLSSRTEQQASALEETAASMEQLGSTVRQNADNARAANQLAVNASTVAAHGGEVVAQVVVTMKGINDSSRKIADIIGVIDGIAFQTNILSLNAAVEAARAGEQGRGFAVVASEVRSLAQRSAEAAKEIKSLIGASVERVEQGSTLVDQAGETMQEVVGAIRRVTDIVGEISAASSEQASGVAQVGEAVTQMDQATQQNAALVEQSAAAAASLTTQAQELVQAVAVFKLAADHQGGAYASASAARPVARRPAPVPPTVAAKKPMARVAPPAAKPPALAARSAAAQPPKPAAPPPASPRAQAGGSDDGEWETF
ncbi:methyl-accepting chemotaxis protein [Ramlibacter sp. H39-3-26]|uniref:methyl-accepting chemotaxis protein n=1 Tax=Curvibacter soli TaxID=3031331 RepID=UPI0023D9B1CC|nr:methyl-accepting chemotaxis protein [Ramlibacter sp. H39-3-26]MDF1485231.1 methyl-accepting chemotaxis protein [Ramlibacter sp. H39-3-26]